MSIQLTPSQERVIPLVRDGLQYTRIAKELGLARGTVINLVHAIAAKLDPIDGVPPYRLVQRWALENKVVQ